MTACVCCGFSNGKESHELLQKQERIIGLHLKCIANMHEYKHSHKYETFFSEKFILK